MSCHDARELFSALLDEALGADERPALDAHLAGCAECRRELERFRGAVALVRGLEPARAPAGFVDRVLAAARPLPWWRRLARALVFPLPVKLPLEAAAIVLVGVIVGLVYRQTPELRQAVRVDEVTAPRAIEPRPAAPAPPAPAPAREPADARRDADAARARQEAAAAKAPATAPPPAVQSYAAPATPPAPAEPRAGDAPAPVAPPAVQAPRSAVMAKRAPAESEAKLGDKGDTREKPDTGVKQEERVVGGAVAETDEAGRRVESPMKSEGPTKREAGAERYRVQRAPAQAESRARVEPAAPPYVSGRLVAADRDAAERALVELVERAGGARLSRRADAEGVVLEVVLPRAAWPALARELRRLGRWEPTREPAALPDPVRVAVHIVG